MDYSQLDLKVGLEIHRQLNTRRKLFCECPTDSEMTGEKISFVRYLREAQSELGELDQAAIFEARKRRRIIYHMDRGCACLVEMDEEPPHPLDMESVEIALTAAFLMDASPVDEIHVMRKIVVDGSNTAGFQRTCVVALGGRIVVDGKVIPIQTITLEEDAARLVNTSKGVVEYDLSRLGIPLIEVATAPVISSPQEAVKAAKAIGDILRATGRVKRGLGTVRQDLNISIKGGALIEVKGVQELDLIDDVIEFEVRRQLHLREIASKLSSQQLPPLQTIDVTEVFESTQSKVIRRYIEKGGRVIALRLAGFAGLLSLEPFKGVRLGAELASYARAWAEVEGIFHTDELPGYGITEKEVEYIRAAVQAKPEDAVILVADVEEAAIAALKAVYERAVEATKGVPSETRAARPDGTTVYLRPRPGAARMYPETDIPPVPIDPDYLEHIRERLPHTLDKLASKLVAEYGLSRQLVEELLDTERVYIFIEIVSKTGAPAKVVAATLTETLTSLAREGAKVERLGDQALLEVFKLLQEGLFSKEALRDVLRVLAENPTADVKEVVALIGVQSSGLDEVNRYVEKLLEDNIGLLHDERLEKRLMGDLMKRFRGKVDGGIIHSVLREKILEKRAQASRPPS
ncbi:MAG: Glu-tRNA(Gln) amidotransferase subunit GatE [Nitrososphaerota archaeon]